MNATAFPTADALLSTSTTSFCETVIATFAMPVPIWPAPRTPIVLGGADVYHLCERPNDNNRDEKMRELMETMEMMVHVCFFRGPAGRKTKITNEHVSNQHKTGKGQNQHNPEIPRRDWRNGNSVPAASILRRLKIITKWRQWMSISGSKPKSVMYLMKPSINSRPKCSSDSLGITSLYFVFLLSAGIHF